MWPWHELWLLWAQDPGHPGWPALNQKLVQPLLPGGPEPGPQGGAPSESLWVGRVLLPPPKCMWMKHLVSILGIVLLTSNETLKCKITKGCLLEYGHARQAHPGAAAKLVHSDDVTERRWLKAG